MMTRVISIFLFISLTLGLAACQPAVTPSPGVGDSPLKVLAVETFLADIAQNVAGDRLKVDALMPVGADPHTFEPSPGDVAKVIASDVLIVNGAGFEGFLDKLLKNAGGNRRIITTSAGLTSRTPPSGEAPVSEPGGDPHFWLNPNNVIRYTENIRDGLSQADPGGAAVYTSNAEAYIAQLKVLDAWIADQVKQIPVERRMLVTNHESLGYFADRYGFKVIGTIVPSVSDDSSPSAGQLAQLVDRIKATGAPAIFLETGTNPQLAQQIAQETGIKVVAGLYTHSTTSSTGPAPTYIAIMKYDTQEIVNALK